MAKIEELTAMQKDHLSAFESRWLEVGLCCRPADFGKAEEQIAFFYERLGKKGHLLPFLFTVKVYERRPCAAPPSD
jgi:hypothetical protein